MPGTIIQLPVDPIQGTLVQVTEGRFVYTYQHTDKRGKYTFAKPYHGQIENMVMVEAKEGGIPADTEKPTPIFIGFVKKILAEFLMIPELKTRDWEWIPKSGQLWCRYWDFDFTGMERENHRLQAEVLRLKQELGRVPVAKPSATIEPKKD